MYGIFDVALDSDIPLPELKKCTSNGVVIRITSGTRKPYDPCNLDWIFHWKSPDGDVCTSCAKCGDFYILRFPSLADFLISKSGDSVLYYPESSVPIETIRHLLLDQVVPRILGQQGRLVLHASAVILPEGKMVAFLGNSGAGKSTIASSFHEAGSTLLTDDCLLVENRNVALVGIPNYFGVRLFNDSTRAIYGEEQKTVNVSHFSSKKRLILPDQKCVSSNITALTAIYLLSNQETGNRLSNVKIRPSRGISDFISIIRQMFVLDISDKDVVAKQFNNVSKIVNTGTEIYYLDYPREHRILPAIREAVRNTLTG